jgi:hypothetical protein
MPAADRSDGVLSTAARCVAALDRGWRAIGVAALIMGLVVGGLPVSCEGMPDHCRDDE